MTDDSSYNEILVKINSARSIFLTTHENPDGDAVASICAMAEWLKSLGKSYYLFCADEPEENLRFLPQTEKISQDISAVDFKDFDAVVVLDCGVLHRTKIENAVKESRLPVINIDHHISNSRFGGLNLVDPDAASTTQILHELFKRGKAEISRELANCILTGIITDSGNFTYAAANSYTFSVASEMLAQGANAREIINYTAKNKNLAMLKAWGFALSRLRHNARYDIAYTVLTQADLAELGINKQELEGLASFLNNLKDAKIILVLCELGDGRIKGSLRTNRGEADVSKLAQVFGGGGHKKAAGFEVEGRLEQTANGWIVK